MIIELILYLIVFLYGIAIGSFLNVCIYRIPLGQEIVKTSSHCMTCGYKLKWYDNIPILSYLLLGGKCRKCRTKLSAQYPIVEASNGLLYLMIFMICGLQAISIVYCLAGSTLIVLSVIEERTGKIPKGLLICMTVLGIAATIIQKDSIIIHLIGLFAVSIFMLVYYFLSHGNGVSMEEVLLMATCGLMIGWQLIIVAFFLGCAIAAIVYAICNRKTTHKFPFVLGPYLSISVMVMALFGYSWIGWYIQFLVK